jgi:hypothetical protein
MWRKIHRMNLIINIAIEKSHINMRVITIEYKISPFSMGLPPSPNFFSR